ncbi:hypothetical protein HX362_004384 [Salmonella enterica]|nr:hypothetical protein [Salmonella enterica]
MSRELLPGLSELVYLIICENPGVFKYDLHRMVCERLTTRIIESDLSDVISFLKLHRSVFAMRGYGYFKDEETFNRTRLGITPGKYVRRKISY